MGIKETNNKPARLGYIFFGFVPIYCALRKVNCSNDSLNCQHHRQSQFIQFIFLLQLRLLSTLLIKIRLINQTNYFVLWIFRKLLSYFKNYFIICDRNWIFLLDCFFYFKSLNYICCQQFSQYDFHWSLKLVFRSRWNMTFHFRRQDVSSNSMSTKARNPVA